jgi:hypothetical protein
VIDVRSVISRVRQNNYPAEWRVYYGQENPGCFYFWESVRHCYLVILPLGVVEWTVGEEEEFSYLSFPDIYQIGIAREMEIVGYDGDVGSRTYYWLDVYGTDGTYLKWDIKNCFGDTASIGKTIIAAYNHYQHL